MDFLYRFSGVGSADNQLIATGDVIGPASDQLNEIQTDGESEDVELLLPQLEAEAVTAVTDVLPNRDNLRLRQRPFSRYV